MKTIQEITIKIECSSDECEELREHGLFFQTIADTLNIERERIKEIGVPKKKSIKQRNKKSKI